jgi:REP element-mobilizing transposase RayT
MRAYFVTLRTWRRGSLFGRVANGKMRPNPVGREVAACWNSLPERFTNVVLDTFVVMPDHLHGIVMVKDSEPLPSILDSFQAASADLVDCGIWKGSGRRHMIRDLDELNRIRHYIRDNPSRWPQNPRDLPPFGRS